MKSMKLFYLKVSITLLSILFAGCARYRVVGSVECRHTDPHTQITTVAKMSWEEIK